MGDIMPPMRIQKNYTTIHTEVFLWIYGNCFAAI